MPYSRMTGRSMFLNNDKNYQKTFFNKRGFKETLQYGTATFNNAQLSQELTLESGVWDTTSRLTLIANDFYGDPQYWWVIALYNHRPTEAHFSPGDIYYIPLPLDVALSTMGV
jgi:hypothetical protein